MSHSISAYIDRQALIPAVLANPTMTQTAQVTVVTAFSNSTTGGNPAAIVFLDFSTLTTEALAAIAQKLNEPITTFISPTPVPTNNEKIVQFPVRYFAPTGMEVPLCGHGTIAAAKAIFTRPDLVSEKVNVLEFQTVAMGIMTASKRENGLVEILLPAVTVEEVPTKDRSKLDAVLTRAFGRNMAINYVAKGGPGFEQCKLMNYVVMLLIHITIIAFQMSWSSSMSVRGWATAK